MLDYFILLVVSLGLLAIVSAFALAAISEKKRATAFAEFAAHSGLQLAADAGEVLSHLPQFHLFKQGHSRRAKHWLRGGQGGEELWIFDYQHVTGAGKNRRTHRHTVAAFPRLATGLPEFQLRPENIFHKIGAAFGYQDIDIQEHPEFSKRYLLRGPAEDAIRQFFTLARVEGLMNMEPMCIEAAETALIIYPPSGRVRSEALPGFIDRVQTVRKLFAEKTVSGVRYRLT